jgi:hypothetical protein
MGGSFIQLFRDGNREEGCAEIAKDLGRLTPEQHNVPDWCHLLGWVISDHESSRLCCLIREAGYTLSCRFGKSHTYDPPITFSADERRFVCQSCGRTAEKASLDGDFMLQQAEDCAICGHPREEFEVVN